MSASFYVFKMIKRRKQSENEYGVYQEDSLPDISKKSNKICRACLKKGSISLLDKKNILLNAMKHFGCIDIDIEDPYPKYLCKTCHETLQSFVKFRKTVQCSDKILRKKTEENDMFLHNDDDIHYTSDDGSQDYLPEEEYKDDKLEVQVKIEGISKKCRQTNKYRVRKPVERIPCEVCKKPIMRYYYKNHVSFVHGGGRPKQKKVTKTEIPDDTKPKFVCYVCGKSFRFQSGYSTHILTHSNDFPFKCQHCPYKGRYAGLLKIHMRTHTRDYKYQCTECVARFLTNSNLHKHMLRHKEKTFKCDSCTRAFHKQAQLDAHVQVDHLGVKNHICNLCHRAFGYRSQMMKHQLYAHKREKLRPGIMPSYLAVQKNDEGQE